MPKPITARPVPASQQPVFTKLATEKPAHFTDKLEYLNRPTVFAHGQLCGLLLSWTCPTAFKRVLKAVIEIKERSADIGEPPVTARFTLFAMRHAYYVIKNSKQGDIISVPEMTFKFFAELQVGANNYSNGWITYLAHNLTAHNTPRFDEGKAPDTHYKEEKAVQKTEELSFIDGGEIPW